MSAGSLTVLRVHDGYRLTKRFEASAIGCVIRHDYDKGATWFSAEAVALADIHELHRLLLRLEPDPGACIIRGAPTPETDLKRTRRNKVAFPETPRHAVMLDVDGIPLPAGCSVLADPAEVAQALLDILAAHAPELEGVTAIVQFSSSAGLEELGDAALSVGRPNIWRSVAKPGVSAHVWIWSATPRGEAELKRWLAPLKAVGLKIDAATVQTVQPHYTAAPGFGAGLQDPLAGRRTLLIKGDEDAAELVIPAEPERPSYTPSEGAGTAGAGRGYANFLDAIGGPDGFRAPMLQAVSSFVASNWPACDLAALKADIRARIAAADPGGRPAQTLRDYASDRHLDSIIQWTMAQEDAKRAQRQAETEAEAARPIAPTYPDRGVPLVEATRLANAAIARVCSRIAAGDCPHLLVKVTVGGGKTFSAVDALPALLVAGRAAGRGPALFVHPRHKLGDQIAADIRARHPGLKVAVWRGLDADDPAQPGKTMCQDRELTRAATAAGQSATQACGACPLRNGCSYHAQVEAGRGADIWVAAHAVKFMQPFAGWPRVTVDGKRMPVPASVVIVDEDMTSAGLAGTDRLHPIQLALSALASDETPNLTGLDRDRLLDLRQRVLAGLTGQPAGAMFRNAVEWMREAPGGLGVSPAREWAVLEWECKPRVKIVEGTTRAEALAAFGAAQAQGFTRLRPLLAERIGAFLATDDIRSVNLTINPEAELGRGQGTGPAIRFAWRQDFHDAWRAPLLFLDATGRAEILRHWAPALEVVDIEVQAPHQHVVQVADREFGRKWAITDGNIKRLAGLLMVETAQADGPVLAVAQVAVERLLREAIQERGGTRAPLPEGGVEDDPATYRFPSGAVLHLAHHGAVTGSNAWQDVATVLVIGRPAMNCPRGEHRAEVIAGRAVATVGDGDSWWPTVPAALRMADGTGRRIKMQPRHPDALAEAVRWAVTEGAVLQAIGRPRGVRRSEGNPVRVVVLAALALPLTVNEAPSWDEIQPDRLVVAAAEAALFLRAMSLAPAALVAAGLFEKPRTAERHIAGFEIRNPLIRHSYKGSAYFKTLAPCRYRTGLRGRWSSALVPLEDGRAALEAVVGHLVAFERVNRPPERQLPLMAMVESKPVPPAVPAVPPCATAPPPLRPIVQPPPSPAARLADLSRRLEVMRPPPLDGDDTDLARLVAWRQRCTGRPEAPRVAA